MVAEAAHLVAIGGAGAEEEEKTASGEAAAGSGKA